MGKTTKLWDNPVHCVSCGLECKRPRRYYKAGDFDADPRVPYSSNGMCSPCDHRVRRESRGLVQRTGIDWSVPQMCLVCNREMRKGNSKPDGRKVHGANGVCNRCLQLSTRRANGVLPPRRVKFDSTHQECSGCSRWLEQELFALVSNPSTKSTGRRTICNRCASLRGLYKMTYTEYQTMYENQNGLCFICHRHSSESPQGLVVDHDHACCPGARSCGKCVRNLLCTYCNTALGSVGDSKDRLLRMIDYLDRKI